MTPGIGRKTGLGVMLCGGPFGWDVCPVKRGGSVNKACRHRVDTRVCSEQSLGRKKL